MTDTSLLTEFQNAQDEIRRLEREKAEKAQQVFAEGAKKIFEKHPIVKNFGWAQYTPYFNDGDPCTFGVHELVVNLEIDEESSTEDHLAVESFWEGAPEFSGYGEQSKINKTVGWRENEKPNPNYDPDYGEAFGAVKALREVFTEQDLEGLFGDHVAVAVTPEKVYVQDYDHE